MEKQSADCRRFPDDLEAEILLRLPIKTLKRFQCACKSWYSLISSPHFQNHHFRRAQSKPPLLLTLKTTKTTNGTILSFSSYTNSEQEALTLVSNFSKTLPEPYYQPLLQFCLGLVCIFHRNAGHPILICNPSTQDLIHLPPTYGDTDCVGFGYSPSTQHFKVVRFFPWERTKTRCQVCTLGTGRWREGKTHPYRVFQGTAPFLHGAMHFLPRISMHYGVDDSDYIAVFDIDTEEYRQGIRLPPYYYSLGNCEGRGIASSRDFVRLTTLGGSLCLTFDFGEHKWLLELWLLKDYNNAEWVKGYTIDVSVYPYTRYSFQAYPVDTEGDDILLNCRDDAGFCLLGYNHQDGTVTVRENKEWAATFYMETFYPLRS